MNIRRWLAVGICGALFVAALSPLWDVWVINVAGILVNRAIVQERSGQGSAAKDDLTKAMALMESAGTRGPHTAGREIPIWRTYGAAAILAPSDHAFEILLRSRNAGRLDRIGELWLGEVASSTAHWDEAREVYQRVDASNLLINQAESSLAVGNTELARIQLGLAKDSLDAATERARARELLLDRTGNEPPIVSELMQNPGERAMSLFRIGRGMMTAGEPAEAVPILEQALETANSTSTGAVTMQSIMLSLGLAIAKSLPPAAATKVGYQPPYYAVDTAVLDQVKKTIRVRALAHQGVKLDVTASACVQAGRILLLAGDQDEAEALLQKALDLDPRFAETYLVLGAYEESRGRSVSARELYKKGAEKLPANKELSTAYALAFYQTMPPRNALPLLERAADESAEDPYVFAFLGDCYADLGMISRARGSYQEGLRKFPDHQGLLERLSALPRTNEVLP